MAGKKNFVLRIDEAAYKALEKWAVDEFRSVNGQIEFLLDQKLKEAGRHTLNKGTNAAVLSVTTPSTVIAADKNVSTSSDVK